MRYAITHGDEWAVKMVLNVNYFLLLVISLTGGAS
jgi:hypothetical protein